MLIIFQFETLLIVKLIVPGVRHNQVEKMHVGYHGGTQLSGTSIRRRGWLGDKSIRGKSFSTIDNIHSTPINAKSQVVLELVGPISLWILWKQRCRRVFSKQTAHWIMLMQEIWSEVVATLKSQYNGLKATPMELNDNDLPSSNNGRLLPFLSQ